MDGTFARATWIAAALTLLPVLVVAQTPEQRIDRALERAQSVGVPVELLESKVAEGRAKGIPLARIAPVVEQRLQVLERVKTDFGERHGLTPSELGVSADAVQSGVSDAAVATLAQNAPRDRRAVAIAVLTELVKQGQASEVALARVTEALQRGGDAVSNLPAQSSGRGNGPPNDVTGRGVGGRSNGRGNGPPGGVTPGEPGGSGRGRGRGGPPPDGI
jgi:hypothetical protein